MNAEAAHLISKLGLAPLPAEGGFFAPTWTSPRRAADGRAAGSSILFLMTETDFSAFHRLRTDEIWHFHAGDPAEVTLLDPGLGSGRTQVLGPDPAGEHVVQLVAPAGVWQGARVSGSGQFGRRGWSLLGCTLAPAWEEREFELARPEALLQAFPGHVELIRSLTR